MSEAESIITELEAGFPALSGGAFTGARIAALASGVSVLETKNSVIYEVFPDGTQIARKQIEPPMPIPTGAKIVIG